MAPSAPLEKLYPPPGQEGYGHEVGTPTAMRRFVADDTTTIDETVRLQVIEAAATRLPDEACGLLLGRRTVHGTEVLGIRICANTTTANPHQNFAIAPGDWIDSWRTAEESGLEVVGVWHSHPGGAIEPSVEDLARAWPEHVQVIATIERDGAATLHAFRIQGRDRHAGATITCRR